MKKYYSIDIKREQYEKSLTNPTVRLLIQDKELLAEVKKILTIK